MPIPLEIVAVVLNTRKLITLKTGSVTKAVKASTSLPIVWPPVQDGDALYVDGGIMLHLPIQQILSPCENGWTFAIDVLSASHNDKPFKNITPYGSFVSGWKILFSKLNPFSDKNLSYPRFDQVMIQCMCLESFHHSMNNKILSKRERTLFLKPPIDHYALFEIRNDELANNLIDIAYRYSQKILSDIPLPPG